MISGNLLWFLIELLWNRCGIAVEQIKELWNTLTGVVMS